MATTFCKLSGIDYPIIAFPYGRDVVAAVGFVHEAARAAAHRNGQYRFGHDSGVNDGNRSANDLFVLRYGVGRITRPQLEGHVFASREPRPFLDIPVNQKAAA